MQGFKSHREFRSGRMFDRKKNDETPALPERTGRAWLGSGEEVLAALSTADDVRFFLADRAGAPVMIFNQNRTPRAMEMFKVSLVRSASASANMPKVVNDGWAVITGNKQTMTVRYDFYGGVLMSESNEQVSLDESLREELLRARQRHGGKPRRTL